MRESHQTVPWVGPMPQQPGHPTFERRTNLTQQTPSSPLELVLQANGLSCSVRFAQREDRLEHQILLDGQVVIRSVEGTDEDWPPSPPLQNVEPFQMDVGTQCLLGTGMAGNSYWSLSVAIQEQGIVFEHACRRPDTNGPWIGATYAANGAKWIPRDDRAYHLAVSENPSQILIIEPMGEDTPAATILEHDDFLKIRPANEAGRTVRFGYWVRGWTETA